MYQNLNDLPCKLIEKTWSIAAHINLSLKCRKKLEQESEEMER